MLVLKGILFVSGISGVGGSSYYLYLLNLPKTYRDLLIRDGFKLSVEDSAYKAAFIDYKDSIEEDISTVKKNDTDAYKKIKTGCESKFKEIPDEKSKSDETLMKKLKKYCVDEQVKVEAKLKRIGKDGWISDDDHYKVIVTLFRKELGFLEINEDSSDVSSEFSKLKTFCTDKLNSPVGPDFKIQTSKLFKGCKPYANSKKSVEEIIKDLQKSNGEKESSDDNFQSKFETGRNTDKLLEFLNSSEGSSDSSSSLAKTTDKSIGGPKLKTGCTNNLSKKIWEDSIWPEKYKFLLSVCKKS